jgi:hypothetical protein
VQLHTLAKHDGPWDDERVEQLVQKLVDIGVTLDSEERRRPKAPLAPLADDTSRQSLLTLMERVLDTLTTSP